MLSESVETLSEKHEYEGALHVAKLGHRSGPPPNGLKNPSVEYDHREPENGDDGDRPFHHRCFDGDEQGGFST